MDDSGLEEGIDTESDTFKRVNRIYERYKYWITHFKRVNRVNEKRIIGTKVLILVFLNEILPPHKDKEWENKTHFR